MIAVLLVLRLVTGSPSNPAVRDPLSPGSLAALSSVPISALVGQDPGVKPPSSILKTAPALSSDGKPEILYIGAEYCPYCAAERWPLVMALSKFGTFSNLASSRSSASDTYPNTPTFTFYGSSYSSPYVTFTPVEIKDRAGNTLQRPTSMQSHLLTGYGYRGGIPFIYLAGRYVVLGAQYDGSRLSGVTFNNALADITSGTDATARAVRAAAGQLVQALCSITGDRPASACASVQTPDPAT